MLVSKNIIYINFNIIDYNYSTYIQDYLFNKILFISLFNKYINKISINNYIIFCQHNSVYTVGRNFNSTLVNNIVYSNLNIPFYKINRGGSITYHGLGQLIIYPVLNLLNFFKDINLYLRLLEQLIILILKDLNINAIRLKKFTGVWVYNNYIKKICSIGIRVSRWITMHGLALNINNNLNYFNNIISCGLKNKYLTTVCIESDKNISISFFIKFFKKYLLDVFLN